MKMMQGALARLFEKIANAGGTDADEHFDELGTDIEKKETPASPRPRGQAEFSGSGGRRGGFPWERGPKASKDFGFLRKATIS